VKNALVPVKEEPNQWLQSLRAENAETQRVLRNVQKELQSVLENVREDKGTVEQSAEESVMAVLDDLKQTVAGLRGNIAQFQKQSVTHKEDSATDIPSTQINVNALLQVDAGVSQTPPKSVTLPRTFSEKTPVPPDDLEAALSAAAVASNAQPSRVFGIGSPQPAGRPRSRIHVAGQDVLSLGADVADVIHAINDLKSLARAQHQLPEGDDVSESPAIEPELDHGISASSVSKEVEDDLAPVVPLSATTLPVVQLPVVQSPAGHKWKAGIVIPVVPVSAQFIPAKSRQTVSHGVVTHSFPTKS